MQWTIIFNLQQEFAAYKEKHPDFDNPLIRSILNKDEKALYDKSVGKPEKPPNSGYSLFSRIMLSSEEIKHINHKDRMLQISSMWKNLSIKDKRKYADKVQQVGKIVFAWFPSLNEIILSDARAIQAGLCHLSGISATWKERRGAAEQHCQTQTWRHWPCQKESAGKGKGTCQKRQHRRSS